MYLVTFLFRGMLCSVALAAGESSAGEMEIRLLHRVGRCASLATPVTTVCWG